MHLMYDEQQTIDISEKKKKRKINEFLYSINATPFSIFQERLNKIQLKAFQWLEPKRFICLREEKKL